MSPQPTSTNIKPNNRTPANVVAATAGPAPPPCANGFAGNLNRTDTINHSGDHATESVSLFDLAARMMSSSLDTAAQQSSQIQDDERLVLAVARIGGLTGQIWAYGEEQDEGLHSSAAGPGGGRQWDTPERSSAWVTNTTASNIYQTRTTPSHYSTTDQPTPTRPHPNLSNFTNPPAYSSPYNPHSSNYGLSPSISTPYSHSYSSTNSASSYNSSIQSHDAYNHPSSSIAGSAAASYFGLRHGGPIPLQRIVTPGTPAGLAGGVRDVRVLDGTGSMPMSHASGAPKSTIQGGNDGNPVSTSGPTGPSDVPRPTSSPISYLHQPPSLEILTAFFSTLFPYHASLAIAHSYLLELVIPGLDKPFSGAVMDLPPSASTNGRNRRAREDAGRASGGRTVYVCLPPLEKVDGDGSAHNRAGAKEGEVQVQMRAEGVVRVSGREKGSNTAKKKSVSSSKKSLKSPVTSPHQSPELESAHKLPSIRPPIDIRDHLTALLDLSADTLNAAELILVLNREERSEEELRELLHALAYVGGGVRSKRRVRGGFEWDERKWVLVGIEL